MGGTTVTCLSSLILLCSIRDFYAQGRIRKLAAKAAYAPRGEQGIFSLLDLKGDYTMKKMKSFLDSLTETVIITKKDQLFMVLIAVLAGCIFGMLFSPRRNQAIICGNGNGCADSSAEPKKKKS